MPYAIKPKGDLFVIVNTDTQEEKGEHASRAEAIRQMRALYANEEAPEKSMRLDYVKSINPTALDSMAVKYVAKDEIKGYTFLWGDPSKTDVELEYFTRNTNFWDASLGKSPRPLTWDHAQDADFKAHPVIGSINDWGDDDMGRWYVAKLDRSHKYRKMIDKLIEQGVLGTSSDSAPQYVIREKTGKSTWLKEWAWFASALTDTPAEPRMIGSLEYLKSLGVIVPEARSNAWNVEVARLKFLQIKSKYQLE